MVVYIRLLKESFGFAINALRNNKLRTLLSLLGVTIGIFSIIAVLTAVDSLDRKIKKDLSTLDKNTIYLMKFSFGPSEIPKWKRQQFHDVTYEEYQYLKYNVKGAENVCFQFFTKPETLKYEGNTVSNINVVPASDEFDDIQKLDFKSGRFYNESESNSGALLTVLGNEVAKNLFDNIDPIGKKIRMYGQNFTVIGVLKKQGAGLFGDSDDTSVYLPSNYLRKNLKMLRMRSLVELLLFVLVVWLILLILVSYNESSNRDSVNLYEAKAHLEQLARKNEEILKKADERKETIKNLNEELYKLQNEIRES